MKRAENMRFPAPVLASAGTANPALQFSRDAMRRRPWRLVAFACALCVQA
jgi:hypothetical protein